MLVPGGLCCIIEHNPWNPATRTIVRRCPVDVDAELSTARETAALPARGRFPCFEYRLFPVSTGKDLSRGRSDRESV